MKQMLIFFIMFVLCFAIDYRTVNLSEAEGDTITITVEGEVETEGPLSLAVHSTIQDALEAVELRENADVSMLNPDTVLHDHDVLSIPARKEETERQRVSINHATEEELMTLSGIGPETARRILDYRKENGLFQTTEDLLNVKGIGEAKYEALKDEITL